MSNDPEYLKQRVGDLEQQVAALQQSQRRPSIRRRSENSFLGLPLWEIALGPDPVAGEQRGHARAIIAIGDIATGWLALGGVARGVVAVGGVALGGVSLGGFSLGLLGAFGGLAIGTVAVGGMAIGLLAVGGAAVGYVAIGGGAFGHFACGGGAVGEHIVSPGHRDPEAVKFFSRWLPWVLK